MAPSEQNLPPQHGDERPTLLGFLDLFRANLLDRAAGLDDEQLRLRLAPSDLTLGRLLVHMAFVEQHWFRVTFAGGGIA